MRKKLILLFACFAYLALTLCGCAGLTDVGEPKKYYIMEIQRPDTPLDPAPDKVLKVMKFDCAKSYRGQELIYRLSENQYESDYYNRFFTTPSSMISEQSREWLTCSGIFASVVDHSSSIVADYYLEAYIAKLYADFTDPAKPFAVMSIQFILYEYQSDAQKLFYEKTYSSCVALTSNCTQDLISAHKKCLSNILKDFESDLRKKIR